MPAAKYCQAAAAAARSLTPLVLRFRGSNHIDASINLVLRSAHAQTSLRSLRKLDCGARVSKDGHKRDRASGSFETLGAPSSAPRSSESDSILMAIVSGPCQTPRKHANAGKEDPRLGARDCFLEILGEPSASVEPSKRPFNHPTS